MRALKTAVSVVTAVISAAALSACTAVNSETVRDMPTGFLCRTLGPDYITTPGEQIAIYSELERRGAQCMPTHQVVIAQSVQTVQ